jgi:hypothetical protein
VKLSRPQLDALRYAKGRMLFAKDINEGNGNRRRTLQWLIKHGMLDWDPLYHGRVVVTAAGEEQIAKGREQLAKDRWNKRPDFLKARWSGFCEAGKHGLDFEGQRCDLCASESL